MNTVNDKSKYVGYRLKFIRKFQKKLTFYNKSWQTRRHVEDPRIYSCFINKKNAHTYSIIKILAILLFNKKE